MNKSSVLVGLSGGVDSAISALLLKQSGLKVSGLVFKPWKDHHDESYINDAKTIAQRLDIPLIEVDIKQQFYEVVVNSFIAQYMEGKTPFPCVNCNKYLKWPVLKEHAEKNDVYHIATGHYAKIIRYNGRLYVGEGEDKWKDQSYFLWNLNQSYLERIIFPLGEYTKDEVYDLAYKHNLEFLRKRKESTGVCFLEDTDYRKFLESVIPESLLGRKGLFKDESGNILGYHNGYFNYTIGQRRGLGFNDNQRWYVKEINPSDNEVILSAKKALYHSVLYLKAWHIINFDDLYSDQLEIRIRYRNQSNKCRVQKRGDLLRVSLDDPLDSIAGGQAGVFYKDGRVIGGGVIENEVL